MNENRQDIRWKQRFKNFAVAIELLSEAVEREHLSELERSGLVQRFEFTVELAWKTLKDVLEEDGFNVSSPKGVFRRAMESGYIGDIQPFLDALAIRNRLSHDYSGKFLDEYEPEIRTVIYPALKALQSTFNERLNE